MHRVKIYLTLVLFFLSWNSFAIYKDSVLISALRNFITTELQFQFCHPFYTNWSRSDKPYVNLYISKGDKVESATKNTYRSFGTNEKAAKERAAKHEAEGHHSFIYKTYATSSAELNERFISYSEEAKCFIVLHEFFHHFRHDLELAIPYEFEEAIGDVIGNYGATEFMQHQDNHLRSIRKQTSKNERVYKIINVTADRIDRQPERVDELNRRCEKKIKRILTHADQFQIDRFNYSVNNGYLLKNRFYSKRYFLLKRLYKKTDTLADFLAIIKKCPRDSNEFEGYVNSLL